MTPGWIATPDDARGMRRLLSMLGGDPAREAAEQLVAIPPGQRIAIFTGFPVAGRPETDGPPGAIALARALQGLGRAVAFLSWDEVLEALAAHVPQAASLDVRAGLRVGDPAVSIEACGRAADGVYRNMHGEDISVAAPRFEDALTGELVVAVGDGGNELGMGAAPAEFFEGLAFPRPFLAARVLVPGTVSNWGALAIVAELSRAAGRDLLPSPAQHQAMLDDLHARGFVDGLSRTRAPLVDGRPFADELAVLSALRKWSQTPKRIGV